ncbi:division/cell wall cluster transcriptional repressor MraZ [candidate division KSB1 bacterium]|nr:division/cell wall cluster transcriptional repressor MraZ [candidate division KSB1 bacterium]
MALLIGEYKYAIDDKGRINIPSRFRKSLGGDSESTFIITKGKEEDKCLDVYSYDVFEKKIVTKLNEFSESDAAQRYYTSLKGSNSHEAPIDKQGRITIPQKLLEYSQITKDVLIIGAINRIELWDPAARDNYLKRMANAEESLDKGLMP